MKRLLLTIVSAVIGIFLIPALFMGAMALVGTIFGFMANPQVGAAVLIILAVISLPGILIGWKIHKLNSDN